MKKGYPRFFVDGYLVFPLDKTTIVNELKMKKCLKDILDFYEKSKEEEREKERYGGFYDEDDPALIDFTENDNFPDPNVEIHGSITLEEREDGRLKISFEGRFVWFGQFMEEDLKILARVPGVEADLSVRPFDIVTKKHFSLKNGNLVVSIC